MSTDRATDLLRSLLARLNGRRTDSVHVPQGAERLVDVMLLATGRTLGSGVVARIPWDLRAARNELLDAVEILREETVRKRPHTPGSRAILTILETASAGIGALISQASTSGPAPAPTKRTA